MRTIKLFVALVLVGLLIIFAIQNVASVQIDFLFWSFPIRRVVLLFLVFGAGLILGSMFTAFGRRADRAEN